MKKIIAISFLFVFLFANTELHQLLKLPLLIHHYLEHHPAEQNKSFTHFLSDHYSDNPEHSDNDNHEHDNLPFNTTDCAIAHISLAFVSQPQFSIQKQIIFHEKISPSYNRTFYSSASVGSIWQPPRFS